MYPQQHLQQSRTSFEFNLDGESYVSLSKLLGRKVIDIIGFVRNENVPSFTIECILLDDGTKLEVEGNWNEEAETYSPENLPAELLKIVAIPYPEEDSEDDDDRDDWDIDNWEFDEEDDE